MPDGRSIVRRAWPSSPLWSAGTRLWVLTMVVVLLASVWWNVRQFTSIVVSALLLAYILLPVIGVTQRRLRLSRGKASVLVYAVLGALIAVVSIVLAPGLVRAAITMDYQAQWNRVTASVLTQLPDSIEVMGRVLPLAPVLQEIERQMQTVEGAVVGRESLVWLAGIASDFAFTAFGVFFTLVASLYVAMDSERFMAWLRQKVPTGYGDVYVALQAEIGHVWRSFFRGQLVLALVVGAMTTAGLLVLGVPYAVPLGVIAGVLEVVPRLGPVLATLPALLVALVQPSSTMPSLPTAWLFLFVLILYLGIQQIENNFLVPRILGGSVNLPPAVVLVGALAGAALAGVIGILLAAPVLGSARVIGSWIFHQLARTEDDQPEATNRAPGHASASGALDSSIDSTIDVGGITHDETRTT